MPQTMREGHSDCGSAGSRIIGQLGIQTLHSKDPNAARKDHHWKAVDEATTGTLTTMETGGSLSKGNDGGDLAGWIGFGSRIEADGNQGANSLPPSFTCHYCKEVGHYKRNCPKLKNKLSSIKSSGEESESLTEFCRQGKIEGRPCKIWLDTGANRSAVPARYIAEVSYTGKEGASLANGTVEMLRTAELTIQVDETLQQMTCFCSRQRCKQKQEMEDTKATVNSGATIKPLDKMSPPKEAGQSISSSRDSPLMEEGASASAEEEDGLVVRKG